MTRTPSTVSMSRLNARRSVLFPHPDGPMIAVIFFSGMSTFTFLSACMDP